MRLFPTLLRLIGLATIAASSPVAWWTGAIISSPNPLTGYSCSSVKEDNGGAGITSSVPAAQYADCIALYDTIHNSPTGYWTITSFADTKTFVRLKSQGTCVVSVAPDRALSSVSPLDAWVLSSPDLLTALAQALSIDSAQGMIADTAVFQNCAQGWTKKASGSTAATLAPVRNDDPAGVKYNLQLHISSS